MERFEKCAKELKQFKQKNESLKNKMLKIR